MNLTAIIDWKEVVNKHFLDSLSVAKAVPEDILSKSKCLDIGSGAGFPGLPIKISFPNGKWTFLEATGKKCEFLRHICHILNIEDAAIVHNRAEILGQNGDYREQFDIVTDRAVSELRVLAELTLPFCKIGGKLIALKTRSKSEEFENAKLSVALLGGELTNIISTDSDDVPDRALVVIEKIRPTPSKYPRRSGMPYKRPL